MDIGKNYEKGAFGVPNELDEINNIWKEFELWEIPAWVKEEVEKNQNQGCLLKISDEPEVNQVEQNEIVEMEENNERKETVDTRTTLQVESEKIKDI
jgi:hypothetical protein